MSDRKLPGKRVLQHGKTVLQLSLFLKSPKGKTPKLSVYLLAILFIVL